MKRLSLVCALLWAWLAPAQAKVFFFPHFADGDGFRVQFQITNLAPSAATGTVRFYDPQGQPLSIPMADGTGSQVSLALSPNQTVVITSQGTSKPLKSGYARVELNQEEVTAVAIYKYANGTEASVMPTAAGKAFSVPVERGQAMSTGLALVRFGSEPDLFRLYDVNGQLVDSRLLSLTGIQTAKFVDEILTVPAQFRGVLTVESDSAFVLLGLRFGSSVLSTVPVYDYVTFKTHFSNEKTTRAAIIEAIDACKSTIDVAIYSFTADEISDALIRAKGRGVAIRVLMDKSQAGGQYSDDEKLIAAGVPVKTRNGYSGGIMHDKYAIFDKRLLLTGSYNWSASAEEDNYENSIFARSIALVERYQAHFDEVWGKTP